jgi:hypothetical protein
MCVMNKRLVPYLILAAGTLLAAFLLWRVYPYAIAQYDTGRYFAQGMNFKWNVLGHEDPWNGPLFSFLLRSLLIFPNPSIAVFWAHSALFMASILMTYRVARTVLSSRIYGFIVAFGFLIVETLSMRTFFYSVEILSDPLYVHLMFIGTLLIILGQCTSKKSTLYSGFAILGMAGIVRKVGVVLIIIWGLFLLYRLLRAMMSRRLKSEYISILICTTLLVGPSSLWSVRNSLLAEAKVGTAGYYLVWRMSEIMSNNNIIKYRSWENAGKSQLVQNEPESTKAVIINNLIDSKENPFQSTNFRSSESDEFRLQIASQIIRLYFWDYISIVSRDYISFFSPHTIADREYIAYKKNPNRHYNGIASKNMGENMIANLYPNGPPTNIEYNEKLSALIFGWCCDNPIMKFMRSLTYSAAVGIHLIGFFSAMLWWCIRKKHEHIERTRIAMTITILLATAFIHALFTVIVTTPSEIRLALPGNMMIHLAAIFFIVGLFQIIISKLRS